QLNRTSIDVPVPARPLIATLRTALAHVLITRDGLALRPGTRSYARSWIRDGAMIAEALHRVGHAGEAADYLRWYAPYQLATGNVPCCVDGRAADPGPERDSARGWLFRASEVRGDTSDRHLLGRMGRGDGEAARELAPRRRPAR